MSEALIAALAAGALPVRRLRPAWQRAGAIVLLAAVVTGLLAAWHGMRPDLGDCWGMPGFAWRLTASVATGVLGTLAAARLGVPGGSSRILLAPVATALTWIAGIGHGCLTAWVALPEGAADTGELLSCLRTVAVVGLICAVALVMLLRRAAPLHRGRCTLAAGLAAAGYAGAALTLLHPIDASAMILVLNLGTAAVLLGLEMTVGARALR